MVRKSCRGTGEVAVIDMAMVGVTTRARAQAMAAPAADSASGAAKRRKTGMMNQTVRFYERSMWTKIGRNAERRLQSEKSTSRPPMEENENSSRCLSPSSDDETLVSCCSSYGSSAPEKDQLKFADLEDQDESAEVDASMLHFTTGRRKNDTIDTSSSEGGGEQLNSMDSVAAELMVVNTPPPLSKDELHLLSDSDEVDLFPEFDNHTEIVKPTEAEIEDFFTAVEAENRSQLENFKKRYNFDFVKEEPLEGRYEWRQRT